MDTETADESGSGPDVDQNDPMQQSRAGKSFAGRPAACALEDEDALKRLNEVEISCLLFGDFTFLMIPLFQVVIRLVDLSIGISPIHLIIRRATNLALSSIPLQGFLNLGIVILKFNSNFLEFF